MADLSKLYLYRMVHIKNIPHILQFGITHSNSSNANSNYKPIGDSSLINTRNSFVMPNGKRLGEYIPFYFGLRTPMLYVIQKGFNQLKSTSAQDIVYCVTTVDEILKAQIDFVFTDGHAVNGLSEFYYPSDIQNIDSIIDKVALGSIYWKDDTDTDLKRRKEAEFLITSDLAPKHLKGFVVYNLDAQNQLLNMGIDQKLVLIKQNFYF